MIANDQKADSLAEAIESAVRDVEAVGLRPVRIGDEDSLTLGEIAQRIGRSREAVRLWSTGKQGPGGSPPGTRLGRDTTFYSWAEVSIWVREQMGLDIPDMEPVLAAANHARQLRALAPRIRRMDVIRRLATAA